MSASRKNCCIRGCNNTSRQKRGVDVKVKFYKFPDSMFEAAWKIAKRKQWIKAVKNYVENPKGWEPNKNTRICSSHFIDNEKSEHPLHPSYVPSIFPGSENVKKNIESLGRFQRVKNRELLKVSNIKKSFVSNETENSINITNSINSVMEQGDHVHVNSVDQNQIDASIESVIFKPVQRSISCQTETVVDETYEELTYFFYNQDYHDGISTAAVQINIPMKKTEDKNCEANIPISKDVRDSSCDPINVDLTKSCQGFHGLSSITTDEVMSSLTGVSLAIFSYLLTLLPDCKASKIDKKTSLLITLMKLKTGLSFTALSVLFNIHRTSAHRIFVKQFLYKN